MRFDVEIIGLEKWNDLLSLQPNAKSAASKAINSTIRKVRTETQKRVLEQVNFPRSYLSPRSGRLTVAKFANAERLEARIRGRGRPTSLARFVKGGQAAVLNRKRNRSVAVEVKPGRVRHLRRAFPLRLRQGKAFTETKFNLGLAIRLRRGERLINKVNYIPLGQDGIFLLYAPSVDQVLLNRRNRGVFSQIENEAAVQLESEFLRLLRI